MQTGFLSSKESEFCDIMSAFLNDQVILSILDENNLLLGEQELTPTEDNNRVASLEVQSTLVISTSVISNNRLSRRENLVLL